MSSEVLLSLKDGNNFYKVAEKLHKQFGHPRANKLIDLVKQSGRYDRKLLDAIQKISMECLVCKKFKKPPSRPVVAMPMAKNFNDMVATDLKVWGSRYFLVMIDVATRYCLAVVINNKNPNTIVSNIITHWIALFGSPRTILNDNGGEYNNDIFRSFGENFNVTLKTTPAQSPWSNGYVERQNATLGSMVRKIMEDCNCSLEIALSWAVAARNCLSNNSGFSPNQLVFGNNPAIPNVFSNELPAMNPNPPSEVIRQNLNAMHSARQAFIKFESNEKVTRALRHNVRSTEANLIQPGDHVYYKRNEQHEWHGPAVVLGRDGKLFMLRHAGVLVRVHECRLCSSNVPESEKLFSEENIHQNDKIDRYEPENKICEMENDDCCVEVESETERRLSNQLNCDIENFQERGVQDVIAEEPSNSISNKDNGKFIVKIGQRIAGTMTSGDPVIGKVHSRAGKASGQFRNCYNIELNNGKIQCMDIAKDFSDVKVVPDDTELLVMYSSEQVLKSKEDEIQNWITNEVYTEVEDIGQSALSVRWVTTEKVKDGKPNVKSRLVARGFEENTSMLNKHSPTCSREAVRLTVSIAAANGWCCNTIDVKAAYLQGKPIEREVYLRPPPEFDEGKLWKLNKTVYGLSDAALQWYQRVKEELLSLGMKISLLDPALFAWQAPSGTKGILCLYVDDILWAGEKTFKETIIDKLSEMFKIGNSASKSFKYIGLNIKNVADGSTNIDQYDYTESVEAICISKARNNNRNSELNEKEKGEYRALIGQLNWVAMQTRPDIAFDVGDHSTKIKNATVADICSLNKIVNRLKNDQYSIHYPVMPDLRSCFIEVYSDASFANLDDGSSQGGMLISLSDQQGARCPIYWESRKIRRVVKSTLAAETLALADAAETAVYITHIIRELIGSVNIPIVCYTDNKSLVDVLESKKNVDDKRLRIDLSVLRDMIHKKEISSIQWVSTSGQLANCLTKRGASAVQLRAAISRC